MALSDQLLNPSKKAEVVDDFCKLLDEEVASKSGISGLAIKAGYNAVKGIKPGYIGYAVEQFLPGWCTALDPIWRESVQKGDPVAHFIASRSPAADAILSVTDARMESVRSSLVLGTYKKLRGSAKKNVEEGIPGLAKLLEKHTLV
ncbi:hypothetical protein [Coleofasciculus sp. FACHB-SPT9]|uniref:DUF6918 family protein n=1 Tax=Cyanophyceae TaxID=3028117 RepID=UPI0016862B86|nr:hypothetical protein [Coleofasciculus sp. FACHB-SPT9]MBD1890656.1 hypothetical protein [Coleofasciculus sp. FACHB-SPT9]